MKTASARISERLRKLFCRLRNAFAWRWSVYFLPFFRRCLVFLRPPEIASRYDFSIARHYWQNVPRAQGGNPFNATLLSRTSDAELCAEFDREMSVAVNKPERKCGFAVALEAITSLARPTVLDYGCGIGFYGINILINHRGAFVAFADINPQTLEVVSRIATAKGFAGHFTTLLVSDDHGESVTWHRPFDLIMAMGVLHHTPYARQIVRGLGQLQKQGSLFEAMLYNNEYWWDMAVRAGRRLSPSGFGRMTDPPVGELTNPYSEPYSKRKACRLFSAYDLLDVYYPNRHYNIYLFRKK